MDQTVTLMISNVFKKEDSISIYATRDVQTANVKEMPLSEINLLSVLPLWVFWAGEPS